MCILRLFKQFSTLPTTSETGIGVIATDKANAAVQNELDQQNSRGFKKHKVYTAFFAKTRAEIGRYAAENGNVQVAAMRKFCSDIPDLEESTVHLFKSAILR